MSETPDLGRRAARGVVSTGLAQGVRFLVQAVSVVVLSRLLLPPEFGAYAVAWGVVGLVDLVRDVGLQASAVRSKHLSDQQSSNLFWVGLAIGVVVAVVVAVVAPFLGPVLGGPDVGSAILGMAPLFVISSATSQYRANLVRALRFHVLNVVDVAAAVLGLVAAITAAWLGAGFWSLVAQVQVSGVVVLVSLVLVTRWRPRRFRRAQGTRALVTFGGTILLSQVIVYAMNTLDSTLVGISSGQAAAGEYNRGAQLVRTPLRQLQAPIGTVAIPVIAKLPPGSPRVERFLRSGQVALALPVFAATAVCVAVPSEVVRLVLGDGWVGAEPVVVLIALAGCLGVVGSPGSMAMVAHSTAGRVAALSVSAGSVTILAMVVGAFWGAVGVAAGLVAAALVTQPLYLTVFQRLGIVRARTLVSAALPSALAAAAGGVLAHLAVSASGTTSHVLAVGLAAVVVLATMTTVVLAWPTPRRDVADVVSAVRSARSA